MEIGQNGKWIKCQFEVMVVLRNGKLMKAQVDKIAS
jgi:hypothetical protein